MEWRSLFLQHFGPGLLGGATLGQWLRILREIRFAVAPSCLPRALAITLNSLQNSIYHRLDRKRFDAEVRAVTVSPPVFLLGHWRQGTTHLHNLLTIDQRFAFPNTFQSCFPHSFLSAEKSTSPMIRHFFPKRRPMDNVEWSLASPQEDEFALCLLSMKSPYVGWVFPNRREYFQQYLTMRGVPVTEIQAWKDAFLGFLKKLTWLYGKPLILKSPPHTCRIRQLLELFPDARFVHIHREPFSVFQSTRKTFRINYEFHRLQRICDLDLDDWILHQYRAMYDVFLEDRNLIPAGQLHEVGFENMERDPIGEVARIYQALNLPDFTPVRNPLQSYVDSLAGYRRNVFPDLPIHLRERIAREWKPCFDEWGYAVS